MVKWLTSRSPVRQDRDGSVYIGSISGLRFSLTRAWPGGNEGFLVSRVAQYRVPVGSVVRIGDPAVLASIPTARLEQVLLRVTVKQPAGAKPTSLVVPALAANFGPAISGAAAAKGSFALSQPALPLRARMADLAYGCEPHHDVAAVPPGKIWGGGGVRSAVDGQVLVLRRGLCSFARKAHFAALAGAKAVIVINSADDDESMIVPSSDGEDKELKALVPLVMVSNSTGATLEKLLRGGEASVRPEEPKEVAIQPLVLGGYTVQNVVLERR